MPESVKDFSKRIKLKYPEYADIDDNELAKRVVDKYPEYKDKVDFGTVVAPAAARPAAVVPEPVGLKPPKMAEFTPEQIAKVQEPAAENLTKMATSRLNPPAGLESGIASMNVAIARTPAVAFSAVTLPGNLLAKYTGGQQTKVPDILINNPVTRYYEDIAKKTAPPELDTNSFSTLKRGDIDALAKELSAKFFANAPTQAIVIGAAMTGNPGMGLAAMGGISAGGQIKQAVESGVDPAMAAQDVILNGGLEVAGEKFGTLGLLKQWSADLATKFGKKTAYEIMKAVGRTVVSSAKVEGAEEFSTQMAQDFADYATGVNPKALTGMFDRAINAGMVGSVSGMVMTAPGAIAMGQQMADSGQGGFELENRGPGGPTDPRGPGAQPRPPMGSFEGTVLEFKIKTAMGLKPADHLTPEAVNAAFAAGKIPQDLAEQMGHPGAIQAAAAEAAKNAPPAPALAPEEAMIQQVVADKTKTHEALSEPHPVTGQKPYQMTETQYGAALREIDPNISGEDIAKSYEKLLTDAKDVQLVDDREIEQMNDPAQQAEALAISDQEPADYDFDLMDAGPASLSAMPLDELQAKFPGAGEQLHRELVVEGLNAGQILPEQAPYADIKKAAIERVNQEQVNVEKRQEAAAGSKTPILQMAWKRKFNRAAFAKEGFDVGALRGYFTEKGGMTPEQATENAYEMGWIPEYDQAQFFEKLDAEMMRREGVIRSPEESYSPEPTQPQRPAGEGLPTASLPGAGPVASPSARQAVLLQIQGKGSAYVNSIKDEPRFVKGVENAALAYEAAAAELGMAPTAENWATIDDKLHQVPKGVAAAMNEKYGNDAAAKAADPAYIQAARWTQWHFEMGKPLWAASGKQAYDVFLPEKNFLASPGQEYTPAPAPAFYSKLVKTIEAKMSGPMPAEQLLGLVKSAGIKQDELDWFDLPRLLKDNPKPTKQQVLDYLRANQLEIQEVTRGGPAGKGGWVVQNPIGEVMEVTAYATEAEAKEAAGNYQEGWDKTRGPDSGKFKVVETDLKREIKPSKFSKYQLPGGENYREVLFILPGKVTEQQIQDKIADVIETWPKLKNEPARARSIAMQKLGDDKGFTSSHWAEPNVLAHMRLNDRTIDGKRTLFIEEVQSDWHQRGRSEGYGVKVEAGVREDENVWVVTNAEGRSGDVPKRFASTAEQALAYAENHPSIFTFNAVRAGVPDAPLKKTWHEFVMKRTLRMAAEEGYDAVAWTTGEQQAERYSLSKQVDKISWGKQGYAQINTANIYKDGNIIAKVEFDSDGKVTHQNGLTDEAVGKPLQSVIGKGVASSILADLRGGELVGEGLNIGGEGMAGFYDQMLPGFVGKFTKKWGGAVKDISLSVSKDETTNIFQKLRELNEDSGVYDAPELESSFSVIKDRMIKNGINLKSAIGIEKKAGKIHAETVGGIGATIETLMEDGELSFSAWDIELKTGQAGLSAEPVHFLAITPELKQAAMAEGFPLFASRSKYNPGQRPVEMGKGYWLMPDGTMHDISSDIGGGTNDHAGFLMASHNKKLAQALGMNDADIKALKDLYRTGEGTPEAGQVLDKVLKNGAVKLIHTEDTLYISSYDFKNSIVDAVTPLLSKTTKKIVWSNHEEFVKTFTLAEFLGNKALFEPGHVYTPGEMLTDEAGAGADTALAVADTRRVRPVGQWHDLRSNPAIEQINKDFIEKQLTSAIGKKIDTIQDEAEIAAMARHPRIEHLVVVKLKKGKVIGSLVLTDGKIGYIDPNMAVIQAFLQDADEFYMSHNHPTGNPAPSVDDIESTKAMASDKRFKGHVVTDHQTYTAISPDGTAIAQEYRGEKVSFRTDIEKMSSAPAVVGWVRGTLQGDKLGIMFVDPQKQVMSFDQVDPRSDYNTYITRKAPGYGSSGVFLVAGDSAAKQMQGRALSGGYHDFLIIKDDGSYRSASLGAVPGFYVMNQPADDVLAEGMFNASRYAETPADYNPDDYNKVLGRFKPGMTLTLRNRLVTPQFPAGLPRGAVFELKSVAKTGEMLVSYKGKILTVAVTPNMFKETFREPGAPQPGQKERQFIDTVRGMEKTNKTVKDTIAGNYDVITNEVTLAEAKAIIAGSMDRAIKLVNETKEPTRLSNTVAMLLIDAMQQQGRFEDAIGLIEHTAERNTGAGQAIQALAMYRRLTPEGILRFADSVIRKATDKLGISPNLLEEFKNLQTPEMREAFAKKYGIPHMTPAVASELYDMATAIAKMEPGRAQDIATGKMMLRVAQLLPKNLWDKVSGLQILAQLLNPKTFVRNLLGNAAFMAFENFSQATGVPLDMLVGTVTGKRTLGLPGFMTQAAGFMKGAKEGTEEALAGIDLKQINNKFDLPRGSAFDSRAMRALESLLNISLKATDRAFYQAAFEDSLRVAMRLAKVTAPTPEMVIQAHLDGLYRTFNDENALRTALVHVKRSFNLNQKWGLGDMVIKYPGTPASILMRGIEYSPFGFMQAVYTLAKAGSVANFDQRAFVQQTTRALNGSLLLVGTGMILSALGLIRGKDDDKKAIREAEAAIGVRDYQINLSGLIRFAESGMDPAVAKMRKGDQLVSYDWMQPMAINLAMGANIQRGVETSGSAMIADALQSASMTLEEQPLLAGISRFFSGRSLTKGVEATIKAIPASFVPTLVNQFRQLIDNVSRNTQSDSYLDAMGNQVKMKVPGLSGELPPRVDVLGRVRKTYQNDTNNPFNVFLNPAFVNRYEPTPTTDLVLDIWARSGETIQLPRIAPRQIKVRGVTRSLTEMEQAQFQHYIGERTAMAFTGLARNPDFLAAPDYVKAKHLQAVLTDIYYSARVNVLGVPPK